MRIHEPPRPLPINPDCVQNTTRDAIERIRAGQILRSSSMQGTGCLVWILMSPFLFLGIYMLIVIVASAGAAVEQAIAGR